MKKNAYICSPDAELAQLVERRLPKPQVTSSNLAFRSKTLLKARAKGSVLFY